MISSVSDCVAISKLSKTVSENKRQIEHIPLSLLKELIPLGGSLPFKEHWHMFAFKNKVKLPPSLPFRN